MNNHLVAQGVNPQVAAPGRPRAAGGQPLRRLPRVQPDADPARAARARRRAARPRNAAVITGKTFFPELISQPFIDGLRIAFSFSLILFLVRRLGVVAERSGHAGPRASKGRCRSRWRRWSWHERHDVDRERRRGGRRHDPDAALLRAARPAEAGGPVGRRGPPLHERRRGAGGQPSGSCRTCSATTSSRSARTRGRGPRRQAARGVALRRHSATTRPQILAEAMEINNSLRAQVRARQATFSTTSPPSWRRARLHRKVARELRAEQTPAPAG